MNVPMHRFKCTKLTTEQIAQKLVLTEAGPKCVSEISDALAGKSFKIVTDNGSAEMKGMEAPKYVRHDFTDENEKTMRVCGFEFEGGDRGVDLSVVGAIARPTGCYDVKHFFGPNQVMGLRS
jgi:hypothetical protein